MQKLKIFNAYKLHTPKYKEFYTVPIPPRTEKGRSDFRGDSVPGSED